MANGVLINLQPGPAWFKPHAASNRTRLQVMLSEAVPEVQHAASPADLGMTTCTEHPEYWDLQGPAKTNMKHMAVGCCGQH